MGTTYYHTVNGKITGQTKDGVRTHFLTDALGSVTTTLADNGAVENTYRYKPYGGILARIGAADDPKFTWLGAAGMRASDSGQYWFPSSSYCSGIGSLQDNTLNPFRLVTNPYVADFGPAGAVVPNCTAEGITVAGPVNVDNDALGYHWPARTCEMPTLGYIIFGANFKLSTTAKQGYIVQHITTLCKKCRCPDNQNVECVTEGDVDFYEAWDITANGQIGFYYSGAFLEVPYDRSYRKIWIEAGHYGQANSRGRFMLCKEVPAEWARGITSGGQLLAGYNPPVGWDDKKTTVARHSAMRWNWCICGYGGPYDQPKFDCPAGLGPGMDPKCKSQK